MFLLLFPFLFEVLPIEPLVPWEPNPKPSGTGLYRALLLNDMSLPLRVFAMIIVPAPVPIPLATRVVSGMI